MATTATTKSTWTDYAILEPTNPSFDRHGNPVRWKVQIDQHGSFRCGCPSFIFSGKGGATKTCKHVRRCQAELHAESLTSTARTPKPQVVPSAGPVHARPVVAPYWEEAGEILTAMLVVGGLTNPREAQRRRMQECLASRLVMLGPKITMGEPVQSAGVGVRRITFDD